MQMEIPALSTGTEILACDLYIRGEYFGFCISTDIHTQSALQHT